MVDTATLVAYYDTADVFVACSEHEGFCVPLLEAMSASRSSRTPPPRYPRRSATPDSCYVKDPCTVAAAVSGC